MDPRSPSAIMSINPFCVIGTNLRREVTTGKNRDNSDNACPWTPYAHPGIGMASGRYEGPRPKKEGGIRGVWRLGKVLKSGLDPYSQGNELWVGKRRPRAGY